MTNRHACVLVLAALLTAGIVHADNASAPSEDATTLQTACVIDDHLSFWLSLEAADRMIARLEKERRALSTKLAKHDEKLELMDEEEPVARNLTLSELGMLATGETSGRETLAIAYDELEIRLGDVERTLKRRRLQRARLEEWLDAYLGVGTTGGP